LDRTSSYSWINWTSLMSLYESFLLLNMFRILLHSSSGATDCNGSLCLIWKPHKWGGPGPIWADAPQNKQKLKIWRCRFGSTELIINYRHRTKYTCKLFFLLCQKTRNETVRFIFHYEDFLQGKLILRNKIFLCQEM